VFFFLIAILIPKWFFFFWVHQEPNNYKLSGAQNFI